MSALVCRECGLLFMGSTRAPSHNAPNFGTSPLGECPGAGQPGITQRQAFERANRASGGGK